MIRGLYFIVSNLMFFLLIAPACVVAAYIVPKYLQWFPVTWGRYVITSLNSSVFLYGEENIPDGPVIIACNHTSMLDIPLLLGYLPKKFHFVVKQSLFKIPLFGRAIKKLGYFPINRTNPRKAVETLRKITDDISKYNKSILIFPEGTRNSQGELQPFKRGMIKMAADAKVPILPIAVRHTHKIIGQKSVFKPGRENLEIHIGEAIDYPTLERADQDKVNDQIWKTINQLLTKENS